MKKKVSLILAAVFAVVICAALLVNYKTDDLGKPAICISIDEMETAQEQLPLLLLMWSRSFLCASAKSRLLVMKRSAGTATAITTPPLKSKRFLQIKQDTMYLPSRKRTG